MRFLPWLQGLCRLFGTQCVVGSSTHDMGRKISIYPEGSYNREMYFHTIPRTLEILCQKSWVPLRVGQAFNRGAMAPPALPLAPPLRVSISRTIQKDSVPCMYNLNDLHCKYYVYNRFNTVE